MHISDLLSHQTRRRTRSPSTSPATAAIRDLDRIVNSSSTDSPPHAPSSTTSGSDPPRDPAQLMQAVLRLRDQMDDVAAMAVEEGARRRRTTTGTTGATRISGVPSLTEAEEDEDEESSDLSLTAADNLLQACDSVMTVEAYMHPDLPLHSPPPPTRPALLSPGAYFAAKSHALGRLDGQRLPPAQRPHFDSPSTRSLMPNTPATEDGWPAEPPIKGVPKPVFALPTASAETDRSVERDSGGGTTTAARPRRGSGGSSTGSSGAGGEAARRWTLARAPPAPLTEPRPPATSPPPPPPALHAALAAPRTTPPRSRRATAASATHDDGGADSTAAAATPRVGPAGRTAHRTSRLTTTPPFPTPRTAPGASGSAATTPRRRTSTARPTSMIPPRAPLSPAPSTPRSTTTTTTSLSSSRPPMSHIALSTTALTLVMADAYRALLTITNLHPTKAARVDLIWAPARVRVDPPGAYLPPAHSQEVAVAGPASGYSGEEGEGEGTQVGVVVGGELVASVKVAFVRLPEVGEEEEGGGWSDEDEGAWRDGERRETAVAPEGVGWGEDEGRRRRSGE
ncbi:hypothetical protein GGF31_001539 [Allomyces arbusculus]|nr:hypothetical protein GGF31_001539 [Allomyces arbusculus]